MSAKWAEHKKRYRKYKERKKELPENYRVAISALERYMNHLGGLDDADSIMLMLEDLIDVFETGAAEGVPVRGIVGEDPVEFAEAFLRKYPAGKWITRERDRLEKSIALSSGE